jgi:nitroreductase
VVPGARACRSLAGPRPPWDPVDAGCGVTVTARVRVFGLPGSRPKTLTPVLAAGDHAGMGDSSDSVTGSTAGQAQVLAGHARFLIAAAARAPSVHNTQPWRFRISPGAVELRSDPRRKLRTDPSGREMLISCGAALFGLRLAVRSLGYLPVTELLPDPAQLRLLARVRTGAAAPPNGLERNPRAHQQPARPAGPSPDVAPARPRNHRVPHRPAAARRTRRPLTPPAHPLPSQQVRQAWPRVLPPARPVRDPLTGTPPDR